MYIEINRSTAPKTKLYVDIISKPEQDNRPIAFVLPGGPGAAHGVYAKYQCLASIADMVFHDPRGCGQSAKGDPQSYTMDNYIDDIEVIRKHLALDKIVIIGKSYGSICALGFALRYPDAVEKLVLSAGAPSYHFLETAKKNIRERGNAEQIKISEKLWAGNFANSEELLAYFKLMQPLYAVKSNHRLDERGLNNKSNLFSYEVLNEGFRNQFWHFDYEQELSKINCPTLILAGREDWINDVKYAELMAKKIPHSELKIFYDASHAMETDVGEDYFQTIAHFIQR